MSSEHQKFAVMVAWAACVIFSAIIIDVPSVAAWAVVVGFALIPPAVALRLLATPAPALAESTNRTRR